MLPVTTHSKLNVRSSQPQSTRTGKQRPSEAQLRSMPAPNQINPLQWQLSDPQERRSLLEQRTDTQGTEQPTTDNTEQTTSSLVKTEILRTHIVNQDVLEQLTVSDSVTEQQSLDKITEQFSARFSDNASNKSGFHQLMQSSFGKNYNINTAETLRQQSLKGDFSWLPKIQLASTNQLQDTSGTQGAGIAGGAYNQNKDTIYLNRALLNNNISLAEKTLSEEIGHAIDARINVKDAKGDEGAIFSKLSHGEKISTAELQNLRSENDSGTVTIDGEKTNVEYGFFSRIKRAFKKVFRGVKKVVKKVGKVVKKVVKGVGKGIKKVAKGIGKVAKKVVTSKLFNTFMNVAQFIPVPIFQVAARIGNVARAAYGVAQGIKNKSWSAVLGGVANIAGGAGNIASKLGVSAKFISRASRIATRFKQASQLRNAISKRNFGSALSLASGYFKGSNTATRYIERLQKANTLRNAVRSGDYLGAVGVGTNLLQDFTGDKGDKVLQSINTNTKALYGIRQAVRTGNYATAAALITNNYGDKLSLSRGQQKTLNKLGNTFDQVQQAKDLIKSHNYAEAAQVLIQAARDGTSSRTTQASLETASQVISQVDQTAKAVNEGRYDQALILAADTLGSPLDNRTRRHVESLQTIANKSENIRKAIKVGDYATAAQEINDLRNIKNSQKPDQKALSNLVPQARSFGFPAPPAQSVSGGEVFDSLPYSQRSKIIMQMSNSILEEIKVQKNIMNNTHWQSNQHFQAMEHLRELNRLHLKYAPSAFMRWAAKFAGNLVSGVPGKIGKAAGMADRLLSSSKYSVSAYAYIDPSDNQYHTAFQTTVTIPRENRKIIKNYWRSDVGAGRNNVSNISSTNTEQYANNSSVRNASNSLNTPQAAPFGWGQVASQTASIPSADPVPSTSGIQYVNSGGNVNVLKSAMAKLPASIQRMFANNNVKLVAVNRSIVEYFPELNGQTPRGWGASTYNSVPGIYHKGAVVVATNASNPSFNLALHEIGHAYDRLQGYPSRQRGFSSVAGQVLPGSRYFSQTGNAGLSERYAESFAHYFGGYTKAHHAVTNYWKNTGLSTNTRSLPAASSPAPMGVHQQINNLKNQLQYLQGAHQVDQRRSVIRRIEQLQGTSPAANSRPPRVANNNTSSTQRQINNLKNQLQFLQGDRRRHVIRQIEQLQGRSAQAVRTNNSGGSSNQTQINQLKSQLATARGERRRNIIRQIETLQGQRTSAISQVNPAVRLRGAYQTQDAAAEAGLARIRSIPDARNHEYGGGVYRYADGSYGITSLRTDGQKAGIALDNLTIQAPAGATIVSYFHNHPGNNAGAYEFSNYGTYGDIVTAEEEGVDHYLTTSDGAVRHYDHRTNRTNWLRETGRSRYFQTH